MSGIACVVVAYGNEKLTRECLMSLLDQTKKVDILLWDNENTGRFQDFSDHVMVHSSPENVYWARAINEGLRMLDAEHGDHDVYMMSNNDILYYPTAVERMNAFIDWDPVIPVAAVAPMGSALGGMQDFATRYGVWMTLAPTISQLNDVIKDRLPLRVSYLIGASLMVNADYWDAVCGLDERMPLGADDHDLCIKIKELGGTLWVAQNVYVEHRGHASGDLAPATWDELGPKSWEFFNRKWAGYYATEDEAIKCHWGGEFVPGWTIGSGWALHEREKWRDDTWP